MEVNMIGVIIKFLLLGSIGVAIGMALPKPEYNSQTKRFVARRVMLLTLIALVGLGITSMLGGCSTVGNGRIDVPGFEDPYQAGRTFVFLDTRFKSYEPAEVRLATDSVYRIALANLDSPIVLDSIVRAQIEQEFSAQTPQERELIYNLYKGAMARVESQIDKFPRMTEIEVLDLFFWGVRDALAVYQPETVINNDPTYGGASWHLTATPPKADPYRAPVDAEMTAE